MATVEKNVKYVPRDGIDQKIKQKMNVPIVVATQMDLKENVTKLAIVSVERVIQDLNVMNVQIRISGQELNVKDVAVIHMDLKMDLKENVTKLANVNAKLDLKGKCVMNVKMDLLDVTVTNVNVMKMVQLVIFVTKVMVNVNVKMVLKGINAMIAVRASIRYLVRTKKSTCENCNCDAIGSKYSFCSQSGQCECKKGYSGEKCDKCAKRFYRPGNKTENECTYCDCNPDGVTRTSDGNCDANGKCDCLKDNSGKDLFEGKQCHEKVFQCRSSRAWKCKGIDKCIYKDYLCDGDNDCGNNSDENCACTPNEGRCLHGSGYGMGQCTPNRKWCYCTDCTSASDTAISVFTFGLWEARSDWSQCKCSFLG